MSSMTNAGFQIIGINRERHCVYIFTSTIGLVEKLEFRKTEVHKIKLFGAKLKQPPITPPRRPCLVVNQISDADTHRTTLERCIKFCSDAVVPVINHPKRIFDSTRDRVAKKLRGIPGAIAHRVLGFQPRSPEEVIELADSSGIGLPFLVRQAGYHGVKVTLFGDHGDLKALHPNPFDGRDFYLSELVDFRAREGHYHKQRSVVIDGDSIIRHVLISNHWNVHAASREAVRQLGFGNEIQRIRELESLIVEKLRPAIDEISKRMGLQYCGIDCCISPERKMTIFEASANMNVFTAWKPELEAQFTKLKNRSFKVLSEWWGEDIE